MNYQHTQRVIQIARTIARAQTPHEFTLRREALAHEYNRMTKWMDTDWASFRSNLDMFTNISNLLQLLKKTDTQAACSAANHFADQLQARCPKKTIVFFAQEFSLWPSFETVWAYFQTRDDVVCKLVVSYDYEFSQITLDDYQAMLNAYRDHGLPAQSWKSYNLMTNCPDMVFYMKPYERRRSNPQSLMIENVMQYVPYTVYISYCFDVQGGKTLHKFFYGMPAFYHMWRIIGYSQFYQQMMAKYGYRNAENVVLLGHPKFDISYNIARDDRYLNPAWQQKIAGRPVVLWNSHFSIRPNEGVGTFFRWWQVLISYFRSHQDLVLLWRPHPIFWELVDQHKVPNERQLLAWIDSVSNMPNVIVDRSGDYRHALRTSNALISDATTFLAEYRPSGKPILFTPKPDGEFVINPAYVNGLKSALIPQDLTGFLDSIRLGTQTADTAGGYFFDEQAGECDGHVGERIGEYVLREMDIDITQKALALLDEKEATVHA